MGILLSLVPLAIFIALLGVYGVFWSIKNNQYEDLEQAMRKVLHDDE